MVGSGAMYRVIESPNHPDLDSPITIDASVDVTVDVTDGSSWAQAMNVSLQF